MLLLTSLRDFGAQVAAWTSVWLHTAAAPAQQPPPAPLVSGVQALHHAATAAAATAAALLLAQPQAPQAPQPLPRSVQEQQPQQIPDPVDVATLTSRLTSELKIAVRQARGILAAGKQYAAHVHGLPAEFRYALAMTAQREVKIFGRKYAFRAELFETHASVSAFCDATLLCALHLDEEGRVVHTLHAPNAPAHATASLAATRDFFLASV